MRLVQLVRAGERRVAMVDGARLMLLDANTTSVYGLAQQAIKQGRPLAAVIEQSIGSEQIDYEPVYEGAGEWFFLPSFDHPYDPARCTVTGTGLTHKASAERRAKMHKQSATEVTDSMRMYEMGLKYGNPRPGQIGLQPEWFYKGNGSILRGHGDDLVVPAYACDGGEEPEIAGAYFISPDGDPLRVGMTIGNEFSDHEMEKKNYLYLAPSKLRNCAIGPELTIGEAFDDVPGSVRILRNRIPIWGTDIWTGQSHMSYSLANLEHHHFKYDMHRRPGDVHIHFFGADAFSFGEGVPLLDGDIMEVSLPKFGRPLQNRLRIADRPEALVSVRPL